MAGNLKDFHPEINDKYFYHAAGISLKTCAEVCDVHLKTVKRWRDLNCWPTWARRLILLYGGYLAQNGWHGWQIHTVDNKLYSPNLRDGFTPSEIESLHYLRQRCDYLERLNSAPAQYLLDC